MALTDEQLKSITSGGFKVVKSNKRPQPKQREQERPGFFKGLAQDIARPFLRTAVSGFQGARGAVALARGDFAEAQKATRPVDLGFFGEISPVSSPREAIGTGLEIGASLVGGGGVGRTAQSLFKRQLAGAIGKGAKAGAQSGALVGAGGAIEEGAGALETVARTGAGAVAGGVGGGALGGGGALTVAGLTPIKTLTNNIAPSLQKLATKIETSLIKPIKRDMEKGFKADNVFKYNLGGSLQESYSKATQALTQLRSDATKLRAGNEKVIDISKIMEDTASALSKDKKKSFGTNKKITTAFKDFIGEFEEVTQDGKLTVPEAQEIKEALGSLGSWLFGNRDLDASAQQKVANTIYTELRTAIEKNSGKGLGQINKAMGEIIPIKNALIRRIPVAERQDLISLKDVVSAGLSIQNPKTWGLTVLDKLTKSGGFAKKLFEAGEKIKGLNK